MDPGPDFLANFLKEAFRILHEAPGLIDQGFGFLQKTSQISGPTRHLLAEAAPLTVLPLTIASQLKSFTPEQNEELAEFAQASREVVPEAVEWLHDLQRLLAPERQFQTYQLKTGLASPDPSALFAESGLTTRLIPAGIALGPGLQAALLGAVHAGPTVGLGFIARHAFPGGESLAVVGMPGQLGLAVVSPIVGAVHLGPRLID